MMDPMAPIGDANNPRRRGRRRVGPRGHPREGGKAEGVRAPADKRDPAAQVDAQSSSAR